MKVETIIITLPLPKRVLSPNSSIGSRGMMFAKASAAKRYRRLACDAVERECIKSMPWRVAEVAVTFFHKEKRRRDQDNAMASLKAAYDGIVDSSLISDDDYKHMKRLPPTFEIDKRYPRVEFTLKRLE
jgi:hypothetical protein